MREKMTKSQDTVKYIIFGTLACVTALALGYFTQGVYQALLGILSFLLVVWIFLILQLTFKRRKRPAPESFSPGDPEQLAELQNCAIAYCDENINYYEGMRYSSRRYYIFFQISIAILTGLTPVLVLLSKDTGTVLPKPLLPLVVWLTILIPAVASIMATTTTIFNFQDDWVQAKKTAESLEALREEYVLGASELFRVDLSTETRPEQQRRALENFILKINAIHLQQVDTWASLHTGGGPKQVEENRNGQTLEVERPTPNALGNRGQGSDAGSDAGNVPDSQRFNTSPQDAGSGSEDLIETPRHTIDAILGDRGQADLNPHEPGESTLLGNSSPDNMNASNSAIPHQDDTSSEPKLI
jgi:hypothetical protein